jgi:hypothetical protein
MNRRSLFSVLLAAICAGLICGCASQYVMKLSNGTQIITANKPKLKGATYYYKDATGKVNTLPQSRVVEVEPASMASEEEAATKPHYREPKKHWWQFWK